MKSLQKAAEEEGGGVTRQAVHHHVKKLRFTAEGENLRALGSMEEDAGQQPSAVGFRASIKQGHTKGKEYLKTGVSQEVYASVMADLVQEVSNLHHANHLSVLYRRLKCFVSVVTRDHYDLLLNLVCCRCERKA
jgi:hypothetical protein